MSEVLSVMGLAVLQNASFTLVSRARNSSSIAYHSVAAVLSNGIWLLMFRKLSMNLDQSWVLAAYVGGSVLGSVGMHWVAIHKIEKKKPHDAA